MELICSEEWPEVEVEFEETLLGHDSLITHCRFSAYGSNIATASADGMIRIWTVGSSLPVCRNATLHSADEIMCLNWKHKSGSLLFIGTEKGGIKVWTADKQRLVWDLHTDEAFPCILDLQCCPRESLFVSAASSSRVGGLASLSTWDIIAEKVVIPFPLTEGTAAMTSVCLNDSGTCLAAGGCDGLIRIFDLSAGHQTACWSAHETAIHSICFGPDETSIFSMGSDGKVSEWSKRKLGYVFRSRGCIRDSGSEASTVEKHEMALDATQSRLLVTSDLVRAPIYDVGRSTGGHSTQAHRAPITSVDWHPRWSIFLTGSADNSVRVTSI